MSRAETKQHAGCLLLHPKPDTTRSHVGVGWPPDSPGLHPPLSFRPNHAPKLSVRRSSCLRAPRVTETDKADSDLISDRTCTVFVQKKWCPLLLCDSLVVSTFRAHRFTRILCFLRMGTPGPLQRAVTKHGAACPSAFSGENACQWVAISNAPPGLHQVWRKEGTRQTSIHQSTPCSPSDQPRRSPQSLLTVLSQGPQRGKPESPRQLPQSHHGNTTVTLEAPGIPQRRPNKRRPPPARHMGKAHRPNSMPWAGAGQGWEMKQDLETCT